MRRDEKTYLAIGAAAVLLGGVAVFTIPRPEVVPVLPVAAQPTQVQETQAQPTTVVVTPVPYVTQVPESYLVNGVRKTRMAPVTITPLAKRMTLTPTPTRLLTQTPVTPTQKISPEASPTSVPQPVWNVVSNGEGGNCRYFVVINVDGRPLTSSEGVGIEAHRSHASWVPLQVDSGIWQGIPGAVVTSLCKFQPVDMIRVSYLGTSRIIEVQEVVPAPAEPTVSTTESSSGTSDPTPPSSATTETPSDSATPVESPPDSVLMIQVLSGGYSASHHTSSKGR